MADQHTVRAYDKDLDLLERRIAEMGGLAEKMVIDAVDALASGDAALAHQVVETDPRLDTLQREIEEQATLTIARRQPVANDLREIIGAIRVAGDLERVGDLAKNIAKRSLKIGLEGRAPHAIVGIKHMNDFATELMKDVLDAYAQRDVERALDVWERDVELDALEDSVFRDLLTHMMEDPRNITFCAHLLFCSKNIERIGDHATNIAETVVYLVTGSTLPTERPHGRQETDIESRRDRSDQVNQARKDMVRPGAASGAAHSDRRGRSGSVVAARLQSRGGRLCGRECRARRRGRTAAGRERARPRDPRLDAARRLGSRNLPTLAGARIDPHASR